MLLAGFRVQFPEFNGVSDALVNAMLAAALLEIDIIIWGPKADQGQGYLAAHKLASSPFGQNARLQTGAMGKDGLTTYWHTYYQLVRQVSSGYRVTL